MLIDTSTAVAAAGVGVAGAALAVSIGSAVYARRAWLASERQARAAEVQTRLATQQESERRAAAHRALVRVRGGAGAALSSAA